MVRVPKTLKAPEHLTSVRLLLSSDKTGALYRTYCGRTMVLDHEGLVGHALADCPECLAIDASIRLTGDIPVRCTECKGVGHVARTDSAATGCPTCGNSGLLWMKIKAGPGA